jgi:hypothetical protein
MIKEERKNYAVMFLISSQIPAGASDYVAPPL